MLITHFFSSTYYYTQGNVTPAYYDSDMFAESSVGGSTSHMTFVNCVLLYSLCFEIPATFTKCGMRRYDDVCH